MRRALAVAASPDAPLGPNPRVGCVLLDAAGAVVAEGHHRGAGTPHAEVDALADLAARGTSATGLTAVVTLEPCNHTGRTGPCSEALLAAGVRRVVHAQSDAGPVSTGGAARLTDAGVEVVGGLLLDEARALNPVWTFSVEQGRPFVTWKTAASLDGRSAAADGTSRWISNADSRRDVHARRGEADVVLAGTGTVLVDDPRLTVRDEHDTDLPRERQPLRAVMGLRELPGERRVLDDAAETVHLRTRDPHAALADLHARGRHHVFLEGGPQLAGAFLEAGLVDEVVAYVAPVLLGGGTHTVEGLDVPTLTAAHRLDVVDVAVLGDGPDRDVRLRMRPRPRERPGDGADVPERRT
ncbi:bifunctional diaminohydroxyphosphoribosylaminopyrimidine deaminase/5-amino-6-(5-phosphoribosylamino)uracil reductase RibD [Nocardioides sp. HDW12B]|nr:bifunctional diaminohydroxyphosphoribosylaminopyrimidine deaminase/5-amino-6-(5-phosphoribosylamino)uracil reductase RibD [Nocardioides sp. HDW12B]